MAVSRVLVNRSLFYYYLISDVFCSPVPELNEISSRILQAMNKDVHPCQDFYEFACGGWVKKNPVPEWTTSWDQLAKLRQQLGVDLRELLEDDNDEGLPTAVLKAKALYRTCMDTDKLEAAGIKPIAKLLKMLGLPPRPPVKASENFTWEVTAGRSRRLLGINVLISLQVAEDVRNNSRNQIILNRASLGFSERYLVQPEQFAHELAQYHKYVHDMIAVADPDTDAQKFADDIVDFSKTLAKIMIPVGARRSGMYGSVATNVEELIQASDRGPGQRAMYNWQEYLDEVFANTSVTLHPQEDEIIVKNLHYFQKLPVVLSNIEPLIIERFLWWRVFSAVAPLTLQSFRSLGFEFSHAVHGVQQRTPRWKLCTTSVNNNFGVALTYMYVKRHFDQDSRKKATDMLEDVRKAFAEAVQQLEWMDSVTRVKTLNKLKAMRMFVGFPTWLFTEGRLDNYYKHAEVLEGSLFDTFLKLKWAAVKESLESFREKPDINRETATAPIVNAYYLPIFNSVILPAAILQPPLCGNGIEAINYGSIGAIMGHEITHGFDNEGRQYDEEGNLKQWWSALTLQHYHQKVQCIIDQYNTYHMPQLPNYTVNGFNTQNENIADNGGLRAALRAYRRYARRNKHHAAQQLPGFSHYQPEQLFFLGFAQMWCGNSTVGALKSQMMEDEHSPNKIRVIGTLSNSKDFANAWKCPKGSPMNPEHKCVLW